MQQIELKKKLSPQEGLHLLFSGLLFIQAAIVKFNFPQENCSSANILQLTNIVYYGTLIWLVYLLISIVPKCASQEVQIFFKVFDYFYSIFLTVVWGYAIYLNGSVSSTCRSQAPSGFVFFRTVYYATWIIMIVFFITFFQKLIKMLHNRMYLPDENLNAKV